MIHPQRTAPTEHATTRSGAVPVEGRRPSPAAEHLGVHIGIEPDHHRGPDSQRGRPQIPRRPHDQRRQRIIIGSVLRKIVAHDGAALRHVQHMQAGEQRDRFVARIPLFLRINRLAKRDIVFSQELLGSGARRSALAKI